MALLAGKLYDPATAVSLGGAASVMTAMDTTNLRLTFTVPPNGSVLVRLNGTVTGAATYSQFLLGVMEGTTVRGRMAPAGMMNGQAATTTLLTIESLFVVSGLTAGASLTWDAAFALLTPATSSQIKYGGPNTAGGTTYGGFAFEIWSTN